MVEDDRVGAGDMGLVLTDPTLYLQYSVQCHAVQSAVQSYLDPY